MSIPMSDFQDSNNAITVKDVYKGYGRNSLVLRNFSMEVSVGSIYALLGSSGCGKTTLLNCIMGNLRADKGSINVKYKHLSDIGYMPQDSALITTLNIEEMFIYYGTLFGMPKKQIDIRVNDICKLLQIPSRNLMCGNLSGGQQRRVSFAVALLHDPKLLILDEPTVGLDPLLSQSIWDYLVTLAVESQKTIILTTHYIEEARQAHMVGLMRGGKLLDQAPPNQLMETNSCSTLEEVFLLLSRADEDSNDVVNAEENCSKTEPVIYPTFVKKERFSLNRLKAQLNKNVLYLLREVPLLIFLFGLPLIQCTLQNVAVGRDPKDIPLAIVNEDHPNCTGYYLNGCDFTLPASCVFLNFLERKSKVIKLINKDNLWEAEVDLRKNKVWGYLYFGSNFTPALVKRVYSHSTLGLSEDVLETGAITAQLDMSNQYLGNLLRLDLAKNFILFLKEFYKNCGWAETLAAFPIRLQNPVYGSRWPVFTHFQTPGVLVAFEFFLPTMFTTAFLIHEKVSGILERTMTTGLTPVEVVLAHTVVQLVILAFQSVIMFLVNFVMFDNPIIGSIILPFSFSFWQGICGMSFGFFLTSISNSHNMAIMSGVGSFFFITYTSGMLWPLEGIQQPLRSVLWWTPLALPTEALRGMTARGWNMTHPLIYTGFLAVFMWTSIFILSTYLIIRYRGFHVKK